MSDEVNLVLVDEVQIQNPWSILDNLVHPPVAGKSTVKPVQPSLLKE